MLPLLLLLIFTVVTFLLAAIKHHLFQQLSDLGGRLSGSHWIGVVIYFLFMYPGIFLHEAAHWIFAFIFGLHPSKFRVWPERIQYGYVLGYVVSQRGQFVDQGLVSAAPFLLGLLVVTLIGQHIFAVDQIISVFDGQGIFAGLGALRHALFRTDRLLWLYLLIVFANEMIPSSSDRISIKPVIGVAAFSILVGLLLEIPAEPMQALFLGLLPFLEAAAFSLVLVAGLDVGLLLISGVLTLLVAPFR